MPSHTIFPGVGTFTYTGNNLTPYTLFPVTGSFSVTGISTLPYQLPITTASFSVTGVDVVRFGGNRAILPVSRAFTLTATDAKLAEPKSIDTRTINVSLRFPTAVTSATLRFLPDLSAGDGVVVLEKLYVLELISDTPTKVLSGSISLPTKSVGTIPYRVQFPRETGYNEHYIYLNRDDNSAIDLSLLLTLTEIEGGTIDLTDLNDVTISNAVSGEYLRYNGTEWTDSALLEGDLPASVMLKSVYDTDTDGIVDKTRQVVMTVRNDTATTLTVGEVVYVSGATGEHVEVKRAQATIDGLSANTLGMVLESITSGADGLIALHGVVTGVNTNAYNEGDALYLSPSVAGGVTSTKTVAPDHLVFIGWVTKKSGNGKIALHIQNGYEIDELHNVYIDALAANDILQYDGPAELWTNKSLADAGIASDSAVVKLTGNQTVAGVKTFSDDLVGTSGASISGTVSVGSNSPTLALKAASSTPSLGLTASRGTLSSPTGIVSGDTLGQLNFFGYSDAFANYVRPAHIWAVATATFNDLPHSTAIQFGTANTGSSSLQRMTLHSPGNLTIGENSDLSVRLVTRSTTEQFRAMYDGSNYASLTVDAAGITTFNAVGTTPRFVFSDPVRVQSTTSPQFRVGYDSGNYFQIGIDFTGLTTLSTTRAQGSVFSEPIKGVFVPAFANLEADINDEVQPDYTTAELHLLIVADDVGFIEPTGSGASDGQKMLIRISNDQPSTTYNLTWDTNFYKGGTIPLPATTIADTTQYLGFMYSSSSSYWELIGYTEV